MLLGRISARGLAALAAALAVGASPQGADARAVNTPYCKVQAYAECPGANFAHTNLRGADLRWANLAGANFYDADLRGANLQGATLTGADFTYAKITGLDTGMSDAKLSNADFNHADLTSSSLYGANLTGAHFTGANLSNVMLWHADLYHADVTDAKIGDAWYCNTRMPDGKTNDFGCGGQQGIGPPTSCGTARPDRPINDANCGVGPPPPPPSPPGSRSKTFVLPANAAKAFDVGYPSALKYKRARYFCGARVLGPGERYVKILSHRSARGGAVCRVKVRNTAKLPGLDTTAKIKVTATTVR